MTDTPVSPAPAAPQPPLTDQPPGHVQAAPILIPTMSLRLQMRTFPAPHIGPNITERRPVLQQRFEGSRGAEWIDVPIVGEDE